MNKIGSFGQKYYFILEGKVGIYTKNTDNTVYTDTTENTDSRSDRNVKKAKKTLHCVREQESKSSFGESDHEVDKPRSETVTCHEDCYFAILNKREFVTIIRQYEQENLIKEMGFFAQLPIFHGNSFYRIKSAYLASQRQIYNKNGVVFKEGQPSKYIYIINTGEFVATRSFHQNSSQSEISDIDPQKFKNEYKQKKNLRVSVLSHPEMFGEEDILTNQNRTYSVVCESSEGSLIAIDKDYFLSKIMDDPNTSQFVLQRLQNKSSNSSNRVQLIENLLTQYSNFVIDDKSSKNSEKDRNNIVNNSRKSTFIQQQISRQNSQENQNDQQKEPSCINLPKDEYFIQEIQQFNQLGYNESFEEENPYVPTSPIRDNKKKRTINISQLIKPCSQQILEDNDNQDIQIESSSPNIQSKSQVFFSTAKPQQFVVPQQIQNLKEKVMYRLKKNYQGELNKQLTQEKVLSKQQASLSPKKQKNNDEGHRDPLSDGFKMQLQIRFFQHFGATNLKSLKDHIPQKVVQDTPKHISEESIQQFKNQLIKQGKTIVPYGGKSGVRNYLRDMQNKVEKKAQKVNTPSSQDKEQEKELEEVIDPSHRSKSVFFDRSKRKSINPNSNTNKLLSKIVNANINNDGNEQEEIDYKKQFTRTNPPSRKNSLKELNNITPLINQTPYSVKSQVNSRKNSLNESASPFKQISVATLQDFQSKKQDISPLKMTSQNRNSLHLFSNISNNQSSIIPIHKNIQQQQQKRDISPLINRYKQPDLLPITKSAIISKLNILQEYQSAQNSQHIMIKNMQPQNKIIPISQPNNNSQNYSIQSFSDCVDVLKEPGLRSKSSNNLSKAQSFVNFNESQQFAKISPNISPLKRKSIQQMPTYKFQQKQNSNQNNNMEQIDENNFVVQSSLRQQLNGEQDNRNNGSQNNLDQRKSLIFQYTSYGTHSFHK